ncbi:MAG: hypothetical protein ACRDG3_12185 [Tepidiformaceae bacterium]
MRRLFRLSGVAFVLLALGAIGAIACGSGKGSAGATALATQAAATGTAETGDAPDAGVGTALQLFGRFPVLWLGDMFDNLPLIRGQITGTVTLVYGDCVLPSGTAVPATAASGTAAGCTPPIQIDVTQPPGASPAQAVAAANGQPVSTVRGVQAVGNALIFTSGLTIEITLGDGAPPLDEVLNGLTLANPQGVNVAPIAAGESLAPLNSAAAPPTQGIAPDATTAAATP